MQHAGRTPFACVVAGEDDAVFGRKGHQFPSIGIDFAMMAKVEPHSRLFGTGPARAIDDVEGKSLFHDRNDRRNQGECAFRNITDMVLNQTLCVAEDAIRGKREGPIRMQLLDQSSGR